MISDGEISRATKLLTSLGLGDLGDKRVLAQLADKHPLRKEEMPIDLEEFMHFPRVHVLTDALWRLDPRAATGRRLP